LLFAVFKRRNELQNIEYLDDNGEASEMNYEHETGKQNSEFGNDIVFPITEEGPFEWFMSCLNDPNYYSHLVDLRWEIAQKVGGNTFQSQVTRFIMKHVDPAVCVKYSKTGRGFNKKQKKQLDSPALEKFVFDCFNRVDPDTYSYKEVSKAIKKFFARSREYCLDSPRRNSRLLKLKVKSECGASPGRNVRSPKKERTKNKEFN
jgi:hypothetical protein